MAKRLHSKLAEKLGLNDDWDEYQITCVNPTPNDVFFNLLDPLVVQQTNVPNTPYGYVQPPALAGGTPTPVVNPCYPDTLNQITYNFQAGNENNTLAYDSNTSRLFSSNIGSLSNQLDVITYKSPTQNFFTASLSVPMFNLFDGVISMAVSITSGKLGILTSKGLFTILDTSTFTILSTVTLSTAALNAQHTQVFWNSINNRFYITSFESTVQDSIIIVDAVTQLEVAAIAAPAASFPAGITFVPSANKMLITYFTSNQIAELNCVTNSLSIIIANTITTQCNKIFYNSNSDIVTYGSNGTNGIRSFTYSTLSFIPVVFASDRLTGATVFNTNNTLYLLTNGGNQIYILDGYTLALNNTIAITNFEINNLDIVHYPPNDEIYINCGQLVVPKGGKYFYLTKNCPPLVFYITGSAEYNDSVRDFFNSPAWTRRIYVYSKSRRNLGQVIQHIYKDANGIECNLPIIPRLSVDVNQFQNWIAQIDFPADSAVFGINQFFQNVLIEKYSEITFILIYKQIEKVKLLTIGRQMDSETICDSFASCPLKVREWSERDLELYDQTTILPFKQNMFLGLKEEAVRPFDFSMLHTYEIENNCKNQCDT